MKPYKVSVTHLINPRQRNIYLDLLWAIDQQKFWK